MYSFVNHYPTSYIHGYGSDGRFRYWYPIRVDMNPDHYKEDIVLETESVTRPELTREP